MYSNRKVYRYHCKEKKEIYIGVDKNICDIIVDNCSRIQTTIFWDEKLKSWKIKDGSKFSLSTSSTWLFAYHSVEITNGMIIKIFGSKIIISYIE